MFWLIDSCQNSVSANRYRLTVSRGRVSTHRVPVFFWRYPLTSWYFSNYRRLKFNCIKMRMKEVVFMSSTFKLLISNWPRTRKFNRLLHYMQGRQSPLTFLTFTHWSRSTSYSYVLIGQNLTGEFMGKIYAASGNLVSDSWSWQSFLSSCLFLLRVQNEIQLLSRLFCNSWLVCLLRFNFCWQMHRLSKSLEILFWMASFSK